MSTSEQFEAVFQKIEDSKAEIAEVKAELKELILTLKTLSILPQGNELDYFISADEYHFITKSFLGDHQPKPKVYFQYLDVPVTHWQRLEKKRIPIFESTTFPEFRWRIRLSFSEEITSKDFHVYKLPHKFTSIDERVLIDDDAKFQECVKLFVNPYDFPPELYIWNYEDESANIGYPIVPKKDSDCSSVVSRDSYQSEICKEKDGYICLCCGYFGAEGMSMKCCHLYEIKSHEALTRFAERKEKLKSLKLVDINELRNLVTMCEKCHTRFGNHQIGIHPTDLRWIITDALRDKSAPSSKPYHDIHSQRVVFTIETYAPPVEVLEDRMVHFVEKNKGKNVDETIHYCHFCSEKFTGVAGLVNKDSHVALCRVTTNASEISL